MNRLKYIECRYCTEVKELFQKDNLSGEYFKIDTNAKCDLIKTLQISLFNKYSSSQNYHYTKELNEILQRQRTNATICYRDTLVLDDTEEYLAKFFPFYEGEEKLLMLSEYYKFHNDIPRMFMLPATAAINWFHDRKRRLEYFRIARLIEVENKQNPDKPPKGIVGDSPLPVRESENVTPPSYESSVTESVKKISLKDKILDELSWLKQDPKKEDDQKGNWKKQLKLDENLINSHDNQCKTNTLQTERQSQTTTMNLKKPIQLQIKKRTSVQTILKIIKVFSFQQNKATQHQRNQSKESQQSQQQQQQLNQFEIALNQIQTPRNQNADLKFNSLTSEKNKITKLLTPPESKSHRTQTSIDFSKQLLTSPKVNSPEQKNQMIQKLKMLELKVLTDLQQLQKTKKRHPLQLDYQKNILNLYDPMSLTQRPVSSEYSDSNVKQKTLQVQRQKDKWRHSVMGNEVFNKAYPSGTVSHREGRKSKQVECLFGKKTQFPVNLSNENNQGYYQQQQVSLLPGSGQHSKTSQISTFAQTNQSSQQNSIIKKELISHQKSISNMIGQNKKLPLKFTFDSEIYKTALSLATKINEQQFQKNKIPLSARNVALKSMQLSEISLKFEQQNLKSCKERNTKFECGKKIVN